MHRIWIGLGAVAGLTAVAMSAVGAHALPPDLDAATWRILDSATRMQGWHALALLAVGLWVPRGGALAHAAGAAFALGVVLFCGALYALALRGLHLGPVAPIGGSLLMLGWLLLGLSRCVRVADIRAAYLAAEGFELALQQELARAGATIDAWHGRLALSPDPPVQAAWALDRWTAPALLPAPSIRAAADALRAIQRNWSAYTPAHHRRAALIEERLPPVKARALVFPEPAPLSHLGAWTLLAPDLMLASATKTSPFVNGECRFVEDRTGPPSRAYLKLWEACTRIGAWPQPGERCLDLGAAPGGWTWAIAQLGADVIAIDRADLAPAIAALPNVQTRQASAFTVPPEPVDWLFSDIIAYPARLLDLVRTWIAAGAARRIVCTIKFQGDTDHDTAAQFAAINGARVMHLFHNRHELTFVWTAAHHADPAYQNLGTAPGA